MSSLSFSKHPSPCRVIVFRSDGEKCIFPDAHISVIVNSIKNEGVLRAEFFRNGQLVVALYDRYSALKFARSLPENHSYDRVIIFRDVKE